MKGRTPLMGAAMGTALESIDTLLRLGADANILAKDNKSALTYALQTDNLAAVMKLLSVSTCKIDLEKAFVDFAKTSIPFVQEIKEFLKKKIDDDNSLLLVGFLNSAKFGNYEMVSVLLEYLSGHHGYSKRFPNIKSNLPEIVGHAIRSDSIGVCKKITILCMYFQYEVGNRYGEIAKSRCIRSITNMFNTNIVRKDDSLQIDNLRQLIQEKNWENVNILTLIPKTKEFQYFNEIDKIRKLIQENENENESILTFDKLLERLHVKDVHYEVKECPSNCEQKLKCQAIRESLILIKYLLKEASKEYPIFENTAVQIVGSLKEGSKINELDEADVLLVLDREPYEHLLEFDQENQKVKFVEKEPRKDHPLEPFRTKDNNFDHQMYFFTFVKLFYKIISNLGSKLPVMLNLSMDPLTTDFVPCQACMNTDLIEPYFERCRHNPGCKLIDGKHREDCDCSSFTSPSLTYSKIGND